MSFAHLATIGTLSYNGYSFDGSAECKCSVEFVYDEAERTVLYHKHKIAVRFYVNDSTDGTDDSLENIRNRLSKAGQALQFIDRGFGDDLIVNRAGGGGLRDVKFGPKPRILSWNPVGNDRTCEVVWEVETCVPVCNTSGVHRTSGIMSVNYGVTFGIEKGFTTRTITGHLIIAMTRAPAGAALPDCADNYRHLVNPALIPDFMRSSQWDISLDKSRVDFTITDTQIRSRNPYPLNVTKIDGHHRVAWTKSKGGAANLRNTISMDIELTPTVNPVAAWTIFGNLVIRRMRFAAAGGRSPFIEEVVADESLFGVSHSFSCSYRLLTVIGDAMNGSAAANLVDPNIFDFKATGLWQPLGTDWRLWQTSLSHVFDNRGMAGLQQLPGNDTIVDLCSSAPQIPWNGAQPPVPVQSGYLAPVLKNQQPPPRRSWIYYKQWFFPSVQKPTVRQSILQSPGSQSQSTDMQSTGGARIDAAGGVDDIVQEGGRGRYTMWVFGRAMRVGYEIPRPAFTRIGGQPATEVAAHFVCNLTGIFFGVPVYSAAWQLQYTLPNAPGVIHPPPNLEN